jgi:hypothetical protein
MDETEDSRGPNGEYLPGTETIREACEAIRGRLSPEELLKRTRVDERPVPAGPMESPVTVEMAAAMNRKSSGY